MVPERAFTHCRGAQLRIANMEFRDYYKVLGVERAASADQIKTAYRRLARKYHPDVSKEPNAEARFKEMQEAYEVLKDPEKRAAYNQLGANWKAGEQFRPPPDWGSGFEFSGGAGRPGGGSRGAGPPFASAGRGAGRSAGRDHHARVGIELEEAYRGTTRTLELRRPEVKPDGSVELRTHTVRVTIPAGVTEGQLIRLAGQGEPPSGAGQAGDLYLEVHLQPHRLFQLEGRDGTLPFPAA